MSRSFPKYNQSVPIEELQPDMSGAQSKLYEGKLDQTFANTLDTLSNNITDKIATVKGRQDAEKQGENWKPATDLTQAGRDYNLSGQTVARNFTTNDMGMAYTKMYMGVINKPINTSKNGSIADLQGQMDSYTKQLMIGKSPEVQSWIQQNYQHAQAIYMPRIAEKVALQQRATSSAAALVNADSADSLVENAAYAYANSPVGSTKGTSAEQQAAQKNSALGEAFAHAQVQSRIANKQLLAQGDIRPEVYANRIANTKYRTALALQKGKLDYYISNYNLFASKSTPQENAAYIKNIENYGENYRNSGLDNNIEGKQRIANYLDGQVKSFMTIQRSQNASVLSDASQGVVLGYTGNQTKINSIWSKLAPFGTTEQKVKYKESVYAGQVSRSLMNSAPTMQSLNILRQNLLTNPSYGQNPERTIPQATLDKAHQFTLAKISELQQAAHHDPAAFIIKGKNAIDYIQSIQDHIPGSTVSQREQHQAVFNGIVNNSAVLMDNTPFSPEVLAAIQKKGDFLVQQEKANGLYPKMTTNADLANMVHIMNTSDLHVAKQLYSNIMRNDAPHAYIWEANLIQAKLSPKVFWFSMPSDKALIDHADYFNDPKNMKTAMEITGVKSLKSMTNMFISNSSLMDKLANLRTSYSNVFTPQATSNTLMNSLETQIAKEVMYRSMQGGVSFKSGLQTYGTKVVQDFLSSKYQNLSLRVPVSITTKSYPHGIKLSMPNITSLMDYTKSMALKNLNTDYYTKHIENKNEKTIHLSMTKIAIQSGRFVPSPDGRGLILVDSVGHPVMMKNGQMAGFSWEDSVDPTKVHLAQSSNSSLPSIRNDFITDLIAGFI